uniref:Death domain-containing protein n=1 Tax=Macrostomum lignano TaxID=282301 RepID=A0A1I8J7R6_9PLAT
MDLTDSFNGIENELRGFTKQLKSRRTEPPGQESAEGRNVKEINAKLNEANGSFEDCNAVLQSQIEASSRAMGALQELLVEVKLLSELPQESDDIDNFMREGGGGGPTVKKRISKDDLKDLLDLSQTLKDTVNLFESVETLIRETLQNSQRGAELAADVQDEVSTVSIVREGRLKENEKKKRKRVRSVRRKSVRDVRRKSVRDVRRKSVRDEEEERQRREEEERQRREEEERQRREEEERQRREEKSVRGRISELRQRQAEEEKKRKSEEKQQLQREREEARLLREEERSWRPVVIKLQDSNEPEALFGRDSPGCAIRAPEGAFIRDEIRCTDASSLLRPCSFPASEEVAGRAVRIEAIGRSELGSSYGGRTVQWFLALPQSAGKSPGKETVLYVYNKNDTSWTEVPSDEIQQGGLPSQYRWFETRMSEVPITIVPVVRWKVSRFNLTQQGAEINSPLDSRFGLTIPGDSISQNNASFAQSFQVRPISQELIDELRTDHPDSYSGLLTTSFLLVHTARAPSETIIVASIDSSEPTAQWNALQIIRDYEKTNTEKLNVRISNLSIIEDFDVDKLDEICREIESNMEIRTVSLIVRQSTDSRMAVVALPSNDKKQYLLELLTSKGFKVVSEPRSPELQNEVKELKVMERQNLSVELTGNITSDEGQEFTLLFNSNEWNCLLLNLSPKDPYLQKSFPTHRGFVQVFSELQPNRIAKQQVQLAKHDSDGGKKPPWRSPFVYKSKDAVTMEYLRELAMDIQDNWSILADQLGVSKERCSAIRNAYPEQSDQALEMLISWLKQTIVLESKTASLIKALKACRFVQLANELRQRELLLQQES